MAAFFALLGVYFASNVFVSSAQNTCKTPNNIDGECIPLEQCSPLYSLLSPTILNEQREFLRKSQCGADGECRPRVCCPLYNGVFTEADLPQPGACGTQTKDGIFGREETSIQDYPWMALLHYKKDGHRDGFLCGGSLIHRYYVVTAAHCLRGREVIRSRYSLDYIRFGEHDLRSDIDCQEGECADPVMDIPVDEIIVHENYSADSNSQAFNNIALIRLKKPTPFTNFIRPICLPTAANLRNKNFDDTLLVVVGFGRTENTSRSDIKMKVEMGGFNLKVCAAIYKQAGLTLSNTVLCAGGEEGRDACSGDSGGPLMGEDSTNSSNPYAYLAGVISFGPRRCGTPGVPGVYTRIDQYIHWIVNKMKK